MFEAIYLILFILTVITIISGIYILFFSKKQTKLLEEMEEKSDAVLKDLIALEKRLNAVEEMNSRRVVDPHRINTILKEAENEEN